MDTPKAQEFYSAQNFYSRFEKLTSLPPSKRSKVRRKLDGKTFILFSANRALDRITLQKSCGANFSVNYDTFINKYEFI